MPQPFRRADINLSFEPNQLLSKPALAAEIGNICASWGLVEVTVAMLYSVLMGDFLPRQAEPGMTTAHPVAFQVFDALNALSPRLELVKRLVKWREPEFADEWSTIENKLRRRFSERSVVAHGFWGVSDDLPDSIVLVSPFSPSMTFKVRDFRAIADRIAREHGELERFLERCKLRRRARPA